MNLRIDTPRLAGLALAGLFSLNAAGAAAQTPAPTSRAPMHDTYALLKVTGDFFDADPKSRRVAFDLGADAAAAQTEADYLRQIEGMASVAEILNYLSGQGYEVIALQEYEEEVKSTKKKGEEEEWEGGVYTLRKRALSLQLAPMVRPNLNRPNTLPGNKSGE